MIKLPEPVIKLNRNVMGTEWRLGYYTEAQLKQAVRDVLEEAAKLASEYGPNRPIVTSIPSLSVRGRWEGEQAASVGIADRIRALIKEIPE